MTAKIKYTTKKAKTFYEEVFICDYEKFDAYKDSIKSKINENAYIKLPSLQSDANCVIVNETDLYISLTNRDLVTEKTIPTLESQIQSKELKSKRIEQIKITSGYLGVFFIENSKKRKIKKIKFKVPQSICIVTKCFDETYKSNETILNSQNKRMEQLENDIQFNNKHFPEKKDRIDELVEEITEVAEEQLRFIESDLVLPNLGFLRIYIHQKKQL